MSNSITFAELRQFLLDLGFVETRIPNTRLLYEHAPSDTILVLRPFRPKDQVDRVTLVVVRRHLIERGLIDAATFDRLLAGTPA